MIQPQPAVAFKFTITVKIQLPQFSVFNLKCLSVHIIHEKWRISDRNKVSYDMMLSYF